MAHPKHVENLSIQQPKAHKRKFAKPRWLSIEWLCSQFIPKTLLQNNENARKSLLLIESNLLFLFLCCLIFVYVVAVTKAVLSMASGISGISILILVLIVVLLNVLKSTFVPCLCFVLWLDISVFISSSFNGGLCSASLGWIPLLPLFAFFLLGSRLGCIWIFTPIIEILILAVAHNSLEDYAAQSVCNSNLSGIALTRAMQVFGVSMIALVYERSRYQAIVQLEQTVKEKQAINDRLREAMAAKSTFLANMSHELRTPMNGIVAMVQELAEMNLSGRTREPLDMLSTCADHMLHLIDEILDFSKIESGQMELEMIPFALDQEIGKSYRVLAVAAAKKGVELVPPVVAEPLPPLRYGDPLRLRQVLMNLLSNAIKFTPSGGRVSLAVRGGPGEHVHFEVRDTGIGISAEQLPHLFQHFSQLDASVSRKYGGSGLGLAISKRLCELMGGNIGVASVPGEGSTFWFDVALPLCSDAAADPVDRVDPCRWVLIAAATAGTTDDRPPIPRSSTAPALADDDAGYEGRHKAHTRHLSLGRGASLADFQPMAILSTSSSSSSSTATAGGVLSGLRVLLVEDNSINQKVVMRMLVPLGCELTVAENGVEAVKVVSHPAGEPAAASPYAFDCVLMDVQMPIMDGFTATKLIREREAQLRLERTPIIALTASATTDYKEKCIGVGFDDFLPKPIKKEHLVAAVQRWSATSPRRAARALDRRKSSASASTLSVWTESRPPSTNGTVTLQAAESEMKDLGNTNP